MGEKSKIVEAFSNRGILFNDLSIVFILESFLKAFGRMIIPFFFKCIFSSLQGDCILLVSPCLTGCSFSVFITRFFSSCPPINVITNLSPDLKLMSLFSNILDNLILSLIYKYPLFAEVSQFDCLTCSPKAFYLQCLLNHLSKWMSK